MNIDIFQINDIFLGRPDDVVLDQMYEKSRFIVYSTKGTKYAIKYDEISNPLRYTDTGKTVYEPFLNYSDVSGFNTVTKINDARGKAMQISAYGFYQCTNLGHVRFPGATNVGQYAFYKDSNLSVAILPELSVAENQSFRETGLIYLDLPKLQWAKSSSFRGNKSMLEFGAQSLTALGDYALNDCDQMTALYIPSIKSVAGESLSYCKKLVSVDFNEVENVRYGSMRNNWMQRNIKVADDNDRFYLLSSDGMTKCKNGYVFIDDVSKGTIWASEVSCPANVILPGDISVIGGQSFYRSSLSTIYCPNVDKIEKAGFQYSSQCALIDFSDRTNLSIPSLAAINALDHLHTYYQVKVPTSLYYTWIDATNWCLSAVKPHVAAEFTEMVGSDGNTYKFTHMDIAQGRGSMDGVVSFIHYNSAGNTIYEPFASIPALSSVSSIQSFSTVDPNISVIGAHSFADCTNLISVNVPYVTILNGVNFDECKKLETVNCSSVTSIGVLTFNDCTAITSLNVPNLTSIENFTMQRCTSMSSLECSSVVQIKRQSLQQCTSLSTLYLPNLTTVGDSSFYLDSNLISVYTPNLSVLGTYSFNGCTNLTSVNVSAVTYIPDYCFFSCKNLPSVNARSLSSIGKYAFFQCKKLSSINLDDTVSVGVQAFNYCSNMSGEMDLPNIETIGNQAFGGCSNITEFDLHNVQSIGSYAFSECYKAEIFDFTDRTLNTVPTLLSANAFNSCGAHASSGTYQIRVPASLYDDWIVATNWCLSGIPDHIVAV